MNLRWLLLMPALLPCLLFAQNDLAIHGWRTYLSHREGVMAAYTKDYLYVLSRVGLTRVKISDKSYKEYSRMDGLSSSNPTVIYYDTIHKTVFIAYKEGLIDYFKDIKNISTIRDIYISHNVLNKGINEFHAHDEYVYMATDFGIIAYDVEKKEIRNSYIKIGDNDPERAVLSLTTHGGRLWAVVDGAGLYSADLKNRNLADASAWRRESGANGLPEGAASQVFSWGDSLYVRLADVVYSYQNSISIWQMLEFPPDVQTSLDNMRWAGANGLGLMLMGNQSSFRYARNTFYNIGFNIDPQHIAVSLDTIYFTIVDGVTGFQHLGSKYREVFFNQHISLPSNKCQDIAVGDKVLYVAPWGYVQNMGASFDNSGIYILDLPAQKWRVLSAASGDLDSVRCNGSIGVVTYDPVGKSAYFSSWESGAFRIQDQELKEIYDTIPPDNCITGVSTSPTGQAQNVRIIDIQIDKAGNRWFILNGATRPLMVLTPEGVCHKFPLPRNTENRFQKCTIDDRGRKWISVRTQGVVIYDNHDDFDNPITHDAIPLRDGAGSGNLASANVNVIRKDRDGSMWLGTSKGVSVFYTPGSIEVNGPVVDAICPIYNGRCLLQEENVTAMAVDAANRKWFGTESSGVYLFNSDGTTQLEHFNIDNSPMLSNNILDIEINHETGDIYFATDGGIISYRGTATEPKPDNNELYVYPNPVLSGYRGAISIQGSVEGAIVRIVTVSGQLVRELHAEGGTTIWDGRDVNGGTVQTGVYLVLVSKDDGSAPGIAKFTVISDR